MNNVSAVERLHQTLAQRPTPERIAEIIEANLPSATPRSLRKELRRVTSPSLQRRFGWSSMPELFRTPDLMHKKVAKAQELAGLFLDATLEVGSDTEALETFVSEFNQLIAKAPGRASFRYDRLGRNDRRQLGLRLSRRRYAKLFRLAGRLEKRLKRLRREEMRHRLVLVSKAALAPQLRMEQLNSHLPTAAFVAYCAARMKLRSEFTIAGQQRPFDKLCAELLRWCEREPGAVWFAIAHVFPRSDVLQRLSDEEKGYLLGRWYDLLAEIAEQLRKAQLTGIDLASMVVKRGNDSTTWNVLAGAWNRARDHWIALAAALGMGELFETILPGKVMRLMAGDVAFWHKASGGDVHPDTRVWAQLPKPWEVIQGDRQCNRAMIEAACHEHGVDPLKSGWSAPRPRTAVAEFRPTPELVHGVAVGNPYFAQLLKNVGAFSGKPLKQDKLDSYLAD